MAIVQDECGYVREDLLNYGKCATCGVTFREDESDWWSLCQDCGKEEEEEDERKALGVGP